MLDYNSFPKFSEFDVWFLKDQDTWKIVDSSNRSSVLGKVNNFGSVESDYLDSTSHYEEQFNLFKLRPEYTAFSYVKLVDSSLEEIVEEYEKRLLGLYLIRILQSGKDIDSIQSPYSMLDWIRTTDFYRAPASTQYHESFVGGLVTHSLKVYNECLDPSVLPKFKDVSLESILMCALIHDWCKIGLYESYQRNVKNEQTGQWEKVDSFRHNQQGLPMGHGVTSMYIASRFIRLSVPEALAIRWHQGRWNVCREEMNELQKSNETYPLVHMLQFADQLSIVNYQGDKNDKKH